MVGFCHTVLHLKEFLTVDVRPAVLLTVHNAGLQRAVNFGKRHRLGRGPHRGHLRLEHVRVLHAEFQAVCIVGRDQRNIGRHLFHAVVPETQAQQAAACHRFFHRHTGFRVLELVNRVDVGEHERQIKDAELLGELLEFRQRRGRHLHVALQHRFKHLVVVVKRRVREHFHAHLAVHLVVDALFQQRGGDAFGVFVGVCDVAELDHDFAVVTGGLYGTGGNGQAQGHGCGCKELHDTPPRVCFCISARPSPKGRVTTE